MRCLVDSVACWQAAPNSIGSNGQRPPVPAAEGNTADRILCLHTEFYPNGFSAAARADRLAREIGRQAVLIACARRAPASPRAIETMQEPFPNETVASNRQLNAAVRARNEGKNDDRSSGSEADTAAAPAQEEAASGIACATSWNSNTRPRPTRRTSRWWRNWNL